MTNTKKFIALCSFMITAVIFIGCANINASEITGTISSGSTGSQASGTISGASGDGSTVSGNLGGDISGTIISGTVGGGGGGGSTNNNGSVLGDSTVDFTPGLPNTGYNYDSSAIK